MFPTFATIFSTLSPLLPQYICSTLSPLLPQYVPHCPPFCQNMYHTVPPKKCKSLHKNRARHGWSGCNGICLVSGPKSRSNTVASAPTVQGSVIIRRFRKLLGQCAGQRNSVIIQLIKIKSGTWWDIWSHKRRGKGQVIRQKYLWVSSNGLFVYLSGVTVLCIYTVSNVLADFAVGYWWRVYKAHCDVRFCKIEGNGRKFRHILVDLSFTETLVKFSNSVVSSYVHMRQQLLLPI